MYITSSKKKIIKKKLPTCFLRRDEKLLFSFRKRIFSFFFQSKIVSQRDKVDFSRAMKSDDFNETKKLESAI
jgi:hypothetical protein